MDFGNWKECNLENQKSNKYTISKDRDENGRLIVEGDMDALLKGLHCISLEEANKSFFNIMKDAVSKRNRNSNL